MLVGLLAPGSARAHDPGGFAEQALPLTQAVTLDGVLQPGEWDDAATFDFTANPDDGRVWTKYDETYVYFAFRRVDPLATAQLYFQVTFDDGHDGTPTTGDDIWTLLQQPVGSATFPADGFYSGGSFSSDLADSGTNETEGGIFYTGGTGEVVFEMRHPRCSPDIAHDVCIPDNGDVVGVTFSYSSEVSSISYPAAVFDQANFGHFSLQIPPPPLDISVLGSSLLPASPREIAVNSATDRAYVAVGNGFDSGSFYVSVREGLAQIADIAAGSGDFSTGPTHVAVNEATNRAYVTHTGSNFARAIDGGTNTSIGTFATGAYPEGIVANPATNRLYIANTNSGSVWVFDTAADANFAMAAIPIPGSGAGITNLYLAFAPADRLYVTAPGLNKIFIVDTDTNGVVDEFAVPGTPSSIVASATTNRLYVKRDGTSDIATIDATTGAVLATIALPGPPIDLALNPTLARLYVTTSGAESDALVVIDTTTNAVLGLRQDVGATTLHTVAVNPANGRIYVTTQAPVYSVIVLDDTSSPPPPPAVPETTIDSAPSDYEQSADATFEFSSDQPDATFECSLDGGTFVECATGATFFTLAEGPHRFEVRALSGSEVDETPAVHRWSVDTVPAVAGAALDQHQGVVTTTDGGMSLGGAGDHELGQVFTPGVSGTLSEVRVAIKCGAGVPMTATVEIQDVDGTPTGTILATATATGIDNLPVYRRFVFSAPIDVNVANEYAIVLSGDTSVTGCFVLGTTNTNPYPGTMFFRDTLNPAWQASNEDLPFATFVEPSAGGGLILGGLDGDFVFLLGYTPDSSVHVTVGEGYAADITVSGAGFAEIPRAVHGQDLVPGLEITAGSKTLTLEDVTFDELNPVTESARGTAPPGRDLDIYLWSQPGPGGVLVAHEPVTADAEGQWSVTFEADVNFGMVAAADLRDEDGDVSRADRFLHAPIIHGSLAFQSISLSNWQPGTVDVSVDGVSRSVSIGATGFGNAPAALFGKTLAPEIVITADQGDVHKSLTLASLTAAIDTEADTVTGTAPPSATVNVNVFNPGSASRQVTASPTGEWTADFSGTFDIVAGTTASAFTSDEDGDTTDVSVTAAPETTIDSGPEGTSNSDGDVFTFSSPTPVAFFECSLDEGPWQQCTSPKAVYVASGPHTFRVRANANFTPDPTPAERTWTANVPAPPAGAFRVDVLPGLVANLDPARAASTQSWQILRATCATLLAYPDQEGVPGVVPEAAAGLPTVSADHKTYTFSIRSGLRFATGEAITAQSFKDAIERNLDPATGGPLPSVNDIESVLAVDDQTLQIALTAPRYYFMHRVATPDLCPVPAGTPHLPLPSIAGSGPYTIESVDANRALLVRNPYYAGSRPQGFTTIEIDLGVEAAAGKERVLAGDSDYLIGGPPLTDTDSLYATYGPGALVQQFFTNPTSNTAFLVMNASRLFDDPSLRQAVNFALDRPAIRQALFGSPQAATLTDQYLAPGVPGFLDASVYPLDGPDVDQARALALAAGVTLETPVQAAFYTTAGNPGRAAAAQVIRDNLAAIGIDVEVNFLPANQLFGSFLPNPDSPYDLALFNWIPGPDPGFLESIFKTGEANNFSRFSDAGIDARIAEAQASLPPDGDGLWAALDADLARDLAPAATLVNVNSRDLFSARMGCQEYHSIFGMSLAALCLAGTDAPIVVTNTNDSGAGSLRQAILDANLFEGSDSITFDIPGAGVRLINLSSALPTATGPVTIDATTQLGWSGTPIVRIDGAGTTSAEGILLGPGSGGSTIAGLMVTNFDGSGIVVSTDGNVVRSNYVGTDGTADLGNGLWGVHVDGFDNTIGGTSVDDRNVIAGNGSSGVRLLLEDDNLVQGNYIGTDATGNAPIPNGAAGVSIEDSAGNEIRNNVVSANAGRGIEVLAAGQDGHLIFDNLIGVGADGTTPLGNGGHGIYGEGDFILVGDNGTLGFTTGGPNTIANNGGAGVFVATGGGNRIVANSIHDNTELGIDLATGANGDQGAPEIQSIEFSDESEVDILASFDAPIAGTYRIDYYANDDCDASGSGEGKLHLAHDLTTSAVGASSFDSTAVGPVAVGDVITATVTGPTNDTEEPVNTSEFSACFVVAAAPGFVVTNTNNSGPGSLRQAILNANASLGLDTITFDIPGEGIRVINTTSSLPLITDPVEIDGTTQLGWFGPPIIRIDGAGQDGGTGLEVAADGSTIRGLMLTNMPNRALSLLSDGNTVAGNYIGTDGISGFEGPIGLYVSGSSNTIGGTSALDRNVVSGFNWAVQIQDTCFEGCMEPGADGNVVQGNYIGTNAAGSAALGNEYVGIELDDASDTTIAGNVISGTGYYAGIYVNSVSGTTGIQGNLIGVKADGIGLLPNQGPGIRIEDDGVLVGGTAPGAGNVIANNGQESVDTGIVVGSGTGNSILGNSIHDNVGLGIALGEFANDGQPAPVLEELLIGAGVTINGDLDADNDTTYRIEFFSSPECDPSGFGEGETYLGFENVLTNDVGNASFTVNFPSAPLDGVITATATDPDGNTSAFSACLEEGIGEVSTAITLTSDEQSASVGAKLVALSAVPSNQLPSFAGSPSSTPVGSIPVGSIPVGSIPVGSIPVGSIPVGSIPVGSIPVGSIPVGSIPVGSIGLNAVPVGSIGLDQVLLSMLPIDADALLLGTPLEDHPRQTITLADVYANDLTRARFEALTLADSGLAQSILAGVPFSAFLLGAATLNQLPPPDAATWCAAIEAAGGDCTGVSGTNTVVGISIAGIPVGSIPVGSIPVGSIPVGSIPVGSIPVGSIDLEASRLAGIPVGSISDPSLVVSCAAETCPTLGDAKQLNAILESAQLRHLVGAFPPDLVLNDLIMGIIPRSALAWESFPIDGFQLFDESGVANTIRYRLRFTVPCPVPSDLSVRVTLPEGWLYKTGTTRWQYGTTATPIAGAEPTTSSKAGARWTSYPPDPCTGGVEFREVELSFQALSGFVLGSEETTASVTMAGATQQATGQAPVLVTQNWEPNDTPADAPTIAKDTLVIGHVAAAGDKEVFRLPIPEVRGTRTTFYLSHIAEGADFDLVIGKPAAPSLQSNPVGSIPVGSIPVEDGGSSVDNSGESLPPETLQDIPVGSIPVGSISASRGSVDEVGQVVADGEEGFYTIVVSGYNGSHSDQPFVLRVVQTPPPALPPCQSRSLALGPAGTLPASLPVATKTLFLVNQQRLAALYPNESVPDMLAAATSIPTSMGVEGAILPVDGNQAVRNAYSAWDTDPCSIDRANDVVAAINAVVAGYRANLPNLRYIVLLGTDEALPMMRRLDPVTISNETDEAPDLFFTTATAQGTRANALYSAAALGYFLSDTVYGAFTSVPWLGRDLYLPNLAVGRLVEGPLDIQRQLELYVSAGGQLSTAKTLTTAYDFLTDGGQAVAAALAGVGTTNATLIDDTWDAADLETAFTDKSPPDDVLSVNAHYSHWLLQPAAGPTLVSTEALPAVQSGVEPAFAGRILFTMGCHAGLNVADTLLPGSLNPRFQDWVQSWGQQRAAVYVANTGFGYGDTEANALSERLMSIFAEKLAQGGAIGERWVDAVHEYFATAGIYGVYDEKALTEATFYGLPFWRIGPDPAAPPAAGPPTDTGLGFAVAPETVTPSLTENVTPRGRFWDANGETLGIHYRPIQPRVAVDVTRTGWVATGALITELRTDDIANVDPVNATPTIDLGANEPERNFQPLIFPASPVALTRSRGFTGDRQHAVVIAGQFRPDETGTFGTERLVRRIGLEIAYVENPTDSTPPLIEQVAAVHTASATIFVKASEDAPGGVVRAAALWSDGTLNADGTLRWNFVPLAQVPGGWSAGPFDTAGPIQVIAMAQNANGLVAYSANKGVNFPSVTDEDGPEILVESPAPGAEYFLNEQVPVSFACSDAGIVTSCTSSPAGDLLDTATVGPKTLTVTAMDVTNNTTTLEIPYTVIYRFSGFFEPIGNAPNMNQLNAGKAVPLRFSLSGDQGLSIFTTGYPASRQIVCDTSVPIEEEVPTTTAGASSLVYESGNDRYRYIWKTESSWANTCRRLIFKFADGKERYLDFKFIR